MPRQKSHYQDSEPPFENLVRQIRFRRIRKYIESNTKVLDIGCGYHGAFLVSISQKIFKGVGLDISVNKTPKAVNVKLIKSSADNKLPFRNSSFNVVVISAVLEHVKFPLKMLEEARRVLKPKGLLLITTPSKTAKPILELLSFKLHLISPDEIKDHKRYYDKESLRNILIKAGFKKSNVHVSLFELGFNVFAHVSK